MLKIKLPQTFGKTLDSIKRFFRFLKRDASGEPRFGVEKPKFIVALQKRKWLWRIISGIFIIITLIIVTATTAYLTMVLTVKGEKVTVPDLYGNNTTEAVERLSDLDLKLNIKPKRQFSKELDEGRIIHQIPEAGTLVKRDIAVRVTLSAGTRTIIVPSLIGQSARNATSLFAQKGLNLNIVSQVHSAGVVTNNIMAQEPAPGTELVRGSRVNILVSLGPKEQLYVMPDLIGMNESQVRQSLTQSGFRIGNVYARHYPGVRRNTIISQYPKAGYSVAKSDIINLWVSE